MALASNVSGSSRRSVRVSQGTVRVGIGFVGRAGRRACARLQYIVRAAPHDGAVPRVSFFYGIVITMYFYDHQPPHFHAQYAEHNAVIAIDGTRVLVGELPGRALKLVAEWAALHREELEADWERVSGGTVPEPIDPLP